MCMSGCSHDFGRLALVMPAPHGRPTKAPGSGANHLWPLAHSRLTLVFSTSGDGSSSGGPVFLRGGSFLAAALLERLLRLLLRKLLRFFGTFHRPPRRFALHALAEGGLSRSVASRRQQLDARAPLLVHSH